MSKQRPGWTRSEMAAKAAADIPDGWYVNLGVGIPTMIADNVPQGSSLTLHSENGILGMGKAPGDNIDRWLVNAGKEYVSLQPGSSLTDQATSFAMIRGGHIDLCVLGAFEISQSGDLANWSLNANDRLPAVGGAMDLAAGARNIWAMTEIQNRKGEPKIVKTTGLPLTAKGVVKRIYTDVAVFDVEQGLVLSELAPGLDVDFVRSKLGPDVALRVA